MLIDYDVCLPNNFELGLKTKSKALHNDKSLLH